VVRLNVFVPLFAVLLAMAGFNWFVGRYSRTAPRLVLQRIQHAPIADYLVLGNSLAECGFDPVAFCAALLPPWNSGKMLNVACGGTLPSETLQFYVASQRRFSHIPLVLYGFMFTQLNAPPKATWSDLVGNRAMLYYSDFELGLKVYEPHLFDALAMRLTRHFPLIYERLNIWRRVELLRRKFDRLGLPAEETTRFGRVADFVNDPFQPANPDVFMKECRRIVDEKGELSFPVREIIKRARVSGSEIVFVGMPLPKARRGYFDASGAWAEYREYLARLIANEHAQYIDALEWFSDDKRYFVDNLHLSEEGAAEFSRRVALIAYPILNR
jgi:hypothetical protein